MNKSLTILLLTITVSTAGQDTPATETPIQIVERLFNNYIKFGDGVESIENQVTMAKALSSLLRESSEKDLPVLINVWMYYDPTDFPVRELIEPIFNRDKPSALAAIDIRLKKKRKGESNKTAPYTDLLALKAKLSKIT
jgi:hypothetical protein